MAAGSPEAVLESGVIERAGRNLWMVARETEELSLLAPVMRQVLAQPQEPRRRQLDWLTDAALGARPPHFACRLSYLGPDTCA